MGRGRPLRYQDSVSQSRTIRRLCLIVFFDKSVHNNAKDMLTTLLSVSSLTFQKKQKWYVSLALGRLGFLNTKYATR